MRGELMHGRWVCAKVTACLLGRGAPEAEDVVPVDKGPGGVDDMGPLRGRVLLRRDTGLPSRTHPMLIP